MNRPTALCTIDYTLIGSILTLTASWCSHWFSSICSFLWC